MVRLGKHPTFLTSYRNSMAALMMVVSVFCYSSALAQDASQRPPHAGEVVGALERAQWETFDDGLRVIEVDTALGTRLTGISIDLERYRFGIIPQKGDEGERVSSVLRRTDARLAINGGFFSVGNDGKLRSVGMLILEGRAQSAAWPTSGGFLALDHGGKPAISLSPDGPPMWAHTAVQSRPVLIEPGGLWAMNTNSSEPARRTLFCLLSDNTALIVIVHGNGLSLFEAGWVLRGRPWGGFFGCDSAIALDGGGSTQLAVRDHENLTVTGLTRVHNIVAVFARDEGETQ